MGTAEVVRQMICAQHTLPSHGSLARPTLGVAPEYKGTQDKYYLTMQWFPSTHTVPGRYLVPNTVPAQVIHVGKDGSSKMTSFSIFLNRHTKTYSKPLYPLNSQSKPLDQAGCI